MKIHFTKQVTEDTFSTLVPLNWLLRIFNLSCLYRDGNQLKVSWSLTRNIIYVLVFGFVNFLILLTKIKRLERFENRSFITFSDTIQISYLVGYLEYIIDLYFVYKYGRDSLLKYFKVYDHIDQLLGMSYEYYKEVRKIILGTVVFCIVIFILSSGFDHISWIEGYGWISSALYSLDYFYYFLNMLTVLDGLSHVIQLEYRLKVIRVLLENYNSALNCVKSIPDENKILKRSSISEIKTERLDSLKILCQGRFIEGLGLKRCYLLLLDQACYMNAMFGVRVLIYSINLLINMINLLYLAIRLYTGSMITPFGSSRLPSASSMARLLSWATVSIIIVYRCEKSYRQCEKIVEIIDLVLINKENLNALKTTLEELRHLLMSRPIKFHAAHFFNIDYTLLVSFTSVVVTYTVIMLQSMQ